VHEISLDEVGYLLKVKAAKGLLIDPKVCAGMYFVGRR